MKTKFIITVPNNRNKHTGVSAKLTRPTLEEILLYNAKDFWKTLNYLPDYISYQREIDEHRYIKQYFPSKTVLTDLFYAAFTHDDQKTSNRLNRKHSRYVERYNSYVYITNQLKPFIEKMEKFITTDFINNKKDYYDYWEKKEYKGKDDAGNDIWKYRIIQPPKDELMDLHKEANLLFQNTLQIHPHEAVHSFRKARSPYTNAKRHQQSKHIVKTDIKDFYPNITKKFLRKQLCSLKEFAIIDTTTDKLAPEQQDYKNTITRFLEGIVELATLNNELPQGAPLSPLLSNLVFTPYDLAIYDYLANKPKEISSTYVMYTRYADDLFFSSLHKIDKGALILKVNQTIADSNFTLHERKTKYFKTKQRVFITGVKINQENNLTYGYEKKEDLKKRIFQTLIIIKNKQNIDEHEVQMLIGDISFAKSIEPQYINNVIAKYARKFNIPVHRFYKHLLQK